ncbi:hypothetical protein TNIN_390521 [Trichonephila inaurata madagascariensis]|uniref:Uncharacterized protein n=1 Tax=Trichonephila inaurata madagascariensis TaxID=2747483 RepID=A0A8X6J359_9ARAC|nr:hypothetical protein TNIN_390521 [Trichonephila inaurata madagascariensis]
MDISPSENKQISACEKLRDTVTSISVLHQTLQVNARFRSFSPRNSSIDLYRMNTEVDSPEEFVLPKKTARPNSPAKDPVETNNSFSDLEQDKERLVPENADFPEETVDKPDPQPVTFFYRVIVYSNTKL